MPKEPKDPFAKYWQTEQFTKGGSILPVVTAKYEPVELPKFLAESSSETTKDGARTYTINNVAYPSITTVLKATDTEGRIMLSKWRNKLGNEAAAKVTKAAAFKGVRWHEFAEKYLKGEKFDWRYFVEPRSLNSGCQLANALNEKIESVLATEVSVYSDAYGVAGRMDVGVRLKDGRLAIMDFKSGSKIKKANRLRQAGVQCTFYADALTEHLPFGSIDTVVVVQILPDSVLWQESKAKDWRPYLLDSIDRYAKLKTQI